jgi:hypothetical protein
VLNNRPFKKITDFLNPKVDVKVALAMRYQALVMQCGNWSREARMMWCDDNKEAAL